MASVLAKEGEGGLSVWLDLVPNIFMVFPPAVYFGGRFIFTHRSFHANDMRATDVHAWNRLVVWKADQCGPRSANSGQRLLDCCTFTQPGQQIEVIILRAV